MNCPYMQVKYANRACRLPDQFDVPDFPGQLCYNTTIKKCKHTMPYKNKEQKKAAERAGYERNKEQRQKREREKKAVAKEKWRNFKSTLSCVQCGQNHPATLDFHHIEKHPDNRSVNKLLTNRAYKQVMEEIKKCMVLCANCHRIHHHNERLEKKKGAEAPQITKLTNLLRRLLRLLRLLRRTQPSHLTHY